MREVTDTNLGNVIRGNQKQLSPTALCQAASAMLATCLDLEDSAICHVLVTGGSVGLLILEDEAWILLVFLVSDA